MGKDSLIAWLGMEDPFYPLQSDANTLMAPATLLTLPDSFPKYSPAGSEGEDSCIDNSYCMYGQYWDGSECTDCPADTYRGFYIWDGMVGKIVKNDPDYPLPVFAAGDESVCLDCPAGDDTDGDTGSLICYPV